MEESVPASADKEKRIAEPSFEERVLKFTKRTNKRLKCIEKEISDYKRVRRDCYIVVTVICGMLVITSPAYPFAVLVVGKIFLAVKDFFKP